ncbi:transporter [Natrinema marinum]|uniref:transporter n=1 Tax=Natrinema marinum TaxID=2961598 RepID=UPI0020C8D68A|nr:transporter [Natrinema marinum]
MTPPSTDSTDRSDPVRLVCLAALVATHGLVRLAERYLPEYLAALGYGPIVVGVLVTLGLGIAVAASERSRAVTDGGSTPAVGTRSTAAALLATVLAAIGLFTWAGAPTLDSLLGTPLSALGWLALGVALLGGWHLAGPARGLWPTERCAATPPSSGNGLEADGAGDRSPRWVTVPNGRTRIVVGALGVAAAAVIATAAMASADAVGAGFALLAAAGATTALVGAVALGSVRDRPPLLGGRPGRDGRSGDADSSLTVVRDAVSRLPDRRRWAVIGDALVRVAFAGILPYLILLVAEYRAIGLSMGGLSFAPTAVFGLFVLAEAGGAILGAMAAPALVSRIDRRHLLVLGLTGLSLVPMALVVAPARASAVAALFGALGCRTVIEPIRPTAGASARAAPVPGSELPPEIRTGVEVAVVPAPLLGGLLYAIDPLVAVTAATTVGLLGVRELVRAFSFDGYR